MTEALQELLGFGQQTIFGAVVLFFRIGAMCTVLPALGEQLVPVRIRLIVALMLTTLMLPMVEIPLAPDAGPAATAALLFSETLIGLIFGLTLKFLSQALLIAGAIAAQATSLSQLFGGSAAPDPQPAIANVIYLAGLTLLVITDLHVKLVWALLELYRVFPIGLLLEPAHILEWGVGTVARVFGFAFVLAAPFVLASLLYNVAMGVINKAMPQLMVAFVGAPAITAGGLVLLFMSIPFLLPIWLARVDGVLASPLQALP